MGFMTVAIMLAAIASAFGTLWSSFHPPKQQIINNVAAAQAPIIPPWPMVPVTATAPADCKPGSRSKP